MSRVVLRETNVLLSSIWKLLTSTKENPKSLLYWIFQRRAMKIIRELENFSFEE